MISYQLMENHAHTSSTMPHLLPSPGTQHHTGLVLEGRLSGKLSMLPGVADLGKHLHGVEASRPRSFTQFAREIHPSFLGRSQGTCMVGKGEAASVFPHLSLLGSSGNSYTGAEVEKWEIKLHLKSVL